MIELLNASSIPNLWPQVFDLLASLMASLAWPVAVVALLLTFRTGVAGILEAIEKRIPHIERLKTPLVEASWSTAAVEDLSKEVESFGLTQPRNHADAVDTVPMQLARVKPSAGVIDAFLDVERQVRRYLKAVGLKQTHMGSPISAFHRSTNAPPQLVTAVGDLAALRNAAAHGGGDISLESALEYTRTASRVSREVESLADRALRDVS